MMVYFKRKLLIAAMVLGISVSVFAQKGNDNSNRRPDKHPPQVVVKDKDPKPPPGNQADKKNGDKRSKP